MPTYDYECRSCGHRFEAFQSMADDPLTKCPDCGLNELRRLIGGGTGIIFKGSGFYVNDSRKSSSTSVSSGNSASTASSGSSGSSAGDSSPKKSAASDSKATA